jgi:cytochrome c oxidase subunit 3
VGVIVLFMAALALYAGWWLSHQRLMAKPWLEEGVIGEFPGGRLSAPPAKISLGVFLAVAGSLFALVISAYVVR